MSNGTICVLVDSLASRYIWDEYFVTIQKYKVLNQTEALRITENLFG